MTDGAKIFYESVVLKIWNLREKDFVAFLDGFEAILNSITSMVLAAEKEAKAKVSEEIP